MRMRTIPKAVEALKKDDPDCDVTYSSIKRMVTDGKLPAVMTGVKALIDMDVLMDLLSGREVTQNATATTAAGTT